MCRDMQGYWRARVPVAPGFRYWFDVDGKRVPDPASRFQPDDVLGASEVIDGNNYTWRCPDWRGRPWHEAVIYEAHVGTLGGYAGVKARLPQLASLGFTALELMPIAEFGGRRGWGYDGVLPYAPECAYGSPDELRALIDDAHALGLMVFLDVVFNHLGPEGNFLPAYAPEFFDTGIKTPWGPAINFKQDAVRQFYTENALYWLEEFHFDGLRLDAVHAIAEPSWVIELAHEVRSRVLDREIHLVLENEDNDAALIEQGITAQWNDDFHNCIHVLLTDETHSYYGDFADQPEARLAKALREGFIYQGDPSRNRCGKPRGSRSSHLAPVSFVNFLQNHDQVGNRALGERLTRLAHPLALRAAMALLLLSPQIPLLFMGEECGAREPFLFFTDFSGELADAVREGRRQEFAGTLGFDALNIPDPNARSTFIASQWTADADDASDWLALIHNLLLLRKEHIIPGLLGCQAIGADVIGTKSVRASWLLGNGRTLTTAVNFAPEPATSRLPSAIPIFGRLGHEGVLAPFRTLVWVTP